MYVHSLSIRYAGIRCINQCRRTYSKRCMVMDRYTEKEDMKIRIDTHFYPVTRNDVFQLNKIIAIKHKEITLAT